MSDIKNLTENEVATIKDILKDKISQGGYTFELEELKIKLYYLKLLERLNIFHHTKKNMGIKKNRGGK